MDLSKLFLHSTWKLDQPGILYNVLGKKFGKGECKKRMVFYFEDTIVSLQLLTIQKLGKEKTSELWYKIGKEAGMRYLLLSKIKKISPIFINSFLKQILLNFQAAGISLTKIISFNKEKKILFLKGNDVIIWRKTKEGSLFVGLISGVMSLLFEQNIEAKGEYEEKTGDCKIVVHPKIQEKYIPSIKELTPTQKYEELNFHKNLIFSPKEASFNDLLNFKRIKISQNKHYLDGNTIVPTEVGLLGIVSHNYSSINQEKLLEQGIVQGAQALFEKINFNKTNQLSCLESIRKMLSALGWGIPHYKITNTQITFCFLYPPITKYGFKYESFVLNGFLNMVFRKTIRVSSINLKQNPPRAIISYDFG